MSLLLVNLLFAFLSVFPGIAIVSKLFKWSVTDGRSVILGILFWNFLFAAGSVVVGCVSDCLNYFFFAFTALGVAVVVWWVLNVIIHKRNLGWFKGSLSLGQIALISFIIVLLVFVLLFMAFHPVFVELDFLWEYFPYAKGLAATGGFHSNPYVASNMTMTRMPLMPSFYAWGLSVFGWESFRLIPFTFIVLVLFVVYGFSKELFPDRKEVSLMAPAVFLSLPVILVSVSLYCFYVDIPMMAFTAASVFCAMMAMRYGDAKWYVFAGVAAALAVLSKEGGYIAIFVSLCVVSLRFSRKVRVLSFASAASLFYFFIIRNSLTLSLDNPLFLVSVVYKQVPIVLLLVLLGLVLFFVPNGAGSLKKESLMIGGFLVPFFAVLFFVLRNWLVFGTPTLMAGFSIYPYELGQPGLLAFLRFDLLFDTTALGNVLLVLVVLGLVFAAKSLATKKNLLVAALCIWLVLLLMDWSFFYNFNIAIGEIRRLLLLAPLVSLIAAVGFSYFIRRLFRQETKDSFVFFFGWLFCLLAWICMVVFQLNFATLRLTNNYVSYVVFQRSAELFSLPTFLASLLIPLAIALLIVIGNRLSVFKTLGRVKLSRRGRVFASSAVLIVVVCVSAVPLNLGQMLVNVNDSGWDSQVYAARALPASWMDYLGEVITYYNSSLHDNYVTVSYGANTKAITYFLDRIVVNLDSGNSGYTFLKSNNTQELLNLLSQFDIRYFLIPKESSTYYEAYVTAKPKFLLLQLLSDENYFVLVKEFTGFSLFTILDQ
jgi:hypothetical protein